MRLDVLLEGMDYEILAGTPDKDVESLVYHSDKSIENSMFFAIKGENEDGGKFIKTALERGSCVVVSESFDNDTLLLMEEKGAAAVKTSDTRKTMALAARKFYDMPDRKLLVIGVTGTKGKTTTSWMIKEIMEAGGVKTGIIGTVATGWNGNYEEAENTTPQSVEVYRLLKEMADGGCRAAVMEVSSQAMMHSRVLGVSFDIAVFTNIFPDHIGEGEHKSFEEYLQWKTRLFEKAPVSVINADSPFADHIAEACRGRKVITFGTAAKGSCGADYLAEKEQLFEEKGMLGARYILDGRRITVGMAGMFNISNSLAAAAACEAAGINRISAEKVLGNIKVRGRTEPVKVSDDFTVLVDYAHNGVSLSDLLTNLRKYNPGRIITVFGCGGNRDRSRRKDMGRAAALLADYSVITSDNPRNEPPQSIIADIAAAMDEAGGKYITVPDRREAILKALHDGRPGDIIVVAGKGHETYQIIKDEKRFFDDRQVILSWKKE